MAFLPDAIVGSIVPVVTPFDSSLAVDWAGIERLIRWQISEGAHGISVTGTTGEPSALSLAERREVIRRAADAVAGEVPFVPGTGTNNLDETIDLTHCAEHAGADAALVIVPYYNRPSQEGLFRYFKAVADSTELPIIVYNIPGRTAVNISPETLARLRDARPQVIGVKESNKDFEHVSLVLKRCGRDFRVYSGIELLCYPILAIGGVGYISATANVLPKPVANLYNRFAAGDLAGAANLHYDLMDMNEALFLETNPGPVKWVMAQMGLIQSHMRLPLCEPAQAVQQRLRAAMDLYGLRPAAEAVL